MDVIGYGFLLGIGIVLAILAFCAVVGIIVLIALFVSYVTGKAKPAPAPVEELEFAERS